MIEVKEIKTKKDLRLFAKYPIELYKGCPYYVPSLRSDEMNTFNPKKNFSLKTNKAKGFLCYKDGKLVGRIAGLINYRHNELSGKKYIRFSRFECIDDIEVFKALLKAIEDFGRSEGMEIMHGPWGFNDTDREGMLTFGFDERSTYGTNYYYPYFHKRMEELGFADESKWLERRFTIPTKVDERIESLAEKLKEKYQLVEGLEAMSLKKFIKNYGHEWFETLNDSYKHLDGYVAIDSKVEKNVLKQFATILNAKYVSILLDKNGKVAAFGVVLPSIANALIKHKGKLFPFGFIDVLKSIHNPKDLEMALTGVRSEYKNSGINSICIARIMKNIASNNIVNLESNPMLEWNLNIQQQWKFIDNKVIKKRQTYQKEISAE